MLRNKLQDEQLQALKNGDKARLETIRFILAQIKNKEIEKKAELSDDETIAILQKIKRELNESLEAAEKGGRTELAQKDKQQIEIVSSYLPAELSDDELKAEIQRIVNDNKELYEKNPKAIIGICMKELKSKAESSRILQILNSL